MRFGKTLRTSVYSPWQDKYIDYDKLKKLLREGSSVAGAANPQDEDDEWTEEDEGAFVEELVNVQLEKVHAFQSEAFQSLRDRTAKCEEKLDPLGVNPKKKPQNGNADGGAEAEEAEKKPDVPEAERKKILEETLKELDGITKETNELERYSRINYSGFLKAGKKHDRRRGNSYRVKPLLLVRLAALPFYKEDYSPLLYRLSAMYSFVRQNLDGRDQRGLSFADSQTGGESFTSHKFWVHPQNLLEVKTVILRRLPVLVYNPQTSKIAEASQPDPTITSIYFDNPKFDLYTKKVDHNPDAASLRLRWYGQLSDKPDIFLEKKRIKEGDASEEQRFTIKDKYVQPFIKGEYKMEKSIQKIQDRSGDDSEKAEDLQKSVDNIQALIREDELQPILRANYSRTAFQIPGDDRVRVSLDTNLVFIREDAIETERPCRDTEDWHRRDIDESEMQYPFKGIRKGEINHFPFAVLEIKTRGRKQYEWVADLMNSHLVKDAPRFSKFVHGTATLFEDYVNSFPFWLSSVETDIRRDPHEAFEEEQEKKAKAAEDETAVGSLFGPRSASVFKNAITSPVGSLIRSSSFKPSSTPGNKRATADMTRRASVAQMAKDSGKENVIDEEDSDDDGFQGNRNQPALTTTAGLRSLFPSFSTSKYAQMRRERQVELPPGVQKPENWIKDQGSVKVEAKVWLANQRTFIKWQHVSVLLASLSLGLYNAAGATNGVARSLAIVYTLLAVFTGGWGWATYMYRSRLIEQRSGKDFDNRFGPVVVCVGLAVALCLNFGFKYSKAMSYNEHAGHSENGTEFLLAHGGDL